MLSVTACATASTILSKENEVTGRLLDGPLAFFISCCISLYNGVVFSLFADKLIVRVQRYVAFFSCVLIIILCFHVMAVAVLFCCNGTEGGDSDSRCNAGKTCCTFNLLHLLQQSTGSR